MVKRCKKTQEPDKVIPQSSLDTAKSPRQRCFQNCTPQTPNYAKPRQWQKSGTSKARTTTNIWQQHPATRATGRASGVLISSIGKVPSLSWRNLSNSTGVPLRTALASLEMTVLLPVPVSHVCGKFLVDCMQDPLQNKKLIASAGIIKPL